MKKFLKNCWESAAFRNLVNLVASVALSFILIKQGVPIQDAKEIGRAGGAVISGQ